MGIAEYSGGAVLSVLGEKCISFCSDHRLGSQSNSISKKNVKFHRIGPKVFVGLAGLDTDNKTLLARIQFRMKLFKLREERDMPVEAAACMISNMLYGKRFGGYMVQPLVGGLKENGDPYLVTMDGIGALSEATEIGASGTTAETLIGVAESLFQPNLQPDDLFHVTAQAMLAGLDRDCLAGWGCSVAV